MYTLRKYLRDSLKYRFKKGFLRQPKYTSKRIQLAKALFCTELLDLIYKKEIMINVNKSSFERSIKRHYSWLPKGMNCAIINDQLEGKATLIKTMWSNSKWFAMTVVGTLDSEKFWIFIKFIKSIIKAEQEDPFKTPAVIVDNARTHTSRFTKEVTSKLEYKIRFLAPYCSEIAPFEQAFGTIKSKIRSQGVPRIINFDKDEGFQIVLNLLASISHAS